MANDFSLHRVDKLRYRPSEEADEFLDQLRKTLVPGEKFRVARLAIARSLAEQGELNLLPKGSEYGSPIEGTHLFGDDSAAWACLVTEFGPGPIDAADVFRAHVEAHWARGAGLLRADMEHAQERDVDFAVGLSELASPRHGFSEGGSTGSTGSQQGKLTIRVGEVGFDTRTNQPVDVTLNGPGVSPHLALMGKTRSGKTRTGLVMAERIVSDGRVPVLIIDPKGEFVKDGELLAKSEWGGKSLADKFPGIQALEPPNRAVPLDFLALPAQGNRDLLIPNMAIAFRDSFRKCVKSRGDVAMDKLRIVVEDLLRTSPRLSLEGIRDAVAQANRRDGKKTETVEAKLSELTAVPLFDPKLSPAQFFSQSWVVGLGQAREESKRLVMFLLLDSLMNYLLTLEDARTDSAGFRGLRHLLLVDEAKEVLAYKHGALSALIRKSAAKGGIVMLLSQSPEDFDQDEDDYLAQMGTIAVFASAAQSMKKLSAVLGRRLRAEDFSDQELPRGVCFTKLPHRDPTKVLAWK